MKKLIQISLTVLVVTLTLVLIGPTTLFAAGPATVNLRSAANFVILAKSGISTTGTTSITGDIGVSPIAATAITGFGLTMDSTNTFSTSSLVTGKVYAADYAVPTPTTMTTAVSDMETAYTDAAGRATPTATELGAGNIGGRTITAGLYKWSTGVTIPTDVTLSGGANDIWIFQIAQTLTTSSGTRVILSGGAQAANIFWQVAGQTTLGTNSVFNGNILDKTAIVMNTGATLNGRALAQTAVTLDANTITRATATTTNTNTNANANANANTNTAVNANANTNTAVNANANTNTAVNANTNANTNTAVNTNTAATTNTNNTTTSTAMPNTGIGPDAKSTPWNIIILSGIIILASTLLVVVLRKHTI